MRVLVAMSGGVDSSVAAALLVAEGHDVVGATMKLWGGAGDSGCCSVGDVEDARWAAQRLGVTHHVFNFTDAFETHVVEPYAAAHAAGRTPNPCIECNRHLKFDRFLDRALTLGFDAIATGHHARVTRHAGSFGLRRAVDVAKDQSYVLAMLGQPQLSKLLLPVGEFTKSEVRARAAEVGLGTAAKPDSQDVCFITSTGGREAFLGTRIGLHAGRLVDTAGIEVGAVPAVELVTVGQRRGMGGGGGQRRYAVSVDTASATVVVGTAAELADASVAIAPDTVSWVDVPVAPGTPVLAQASAHGRASPAVWSGDGVRWQVPQRRVAPGQTLVLYDDDRVLGAAVAA
ncbi:MAG TPA: tRNA 2-thiouridine(34) synthase MnmA [Acidimicrobiales bacterium]|nr:tRNA 2-thiouridine(34) synthase MnmA [Acidimicrobiales bacterium]